MVLGGWGSVNLSHVFTLHPPEIRLLLTKRERWIFYNRDFDPNPLVGWDLHFYSVVIRTHSSSLE